MDPWVHWTRSPWTQLGVTGAQQEPQPPSGLLCLSERIQEAIPKHPRILDVAVLDLERITQEGPSESRLPAEPGHHGGQALGQLLP